MDSISKSVLLEIFYAFRKRLGCNSSIFILVWECLIILLREFNSACPLESILSVREVMLCNPYMIHWLSIIIIYTSSCNGVDNGVEIEMRQHHVVQGQIPCISLQDAHKSSWRQLYYLENGKWSGVDSKNCCSYSSQFFNTTRHLVIDLTLKRYPPEVKSAQWWLLAL